MIAQLRKSISAILPQSLKSRIKAQLYSAEVFEQIKKDEEIYRLTKLPRYQSDKTTLSGKKLEILDAVSYLFTKTEIFDKEIYKFKAGIPNPYIIDGGANIGLSTIYFKRLYPQAILTAFEPDPKVFEVLTHNVKSFGLTDVKLIQKGLWNTETSLSFASEGADAGRIEESESEMQRISIVTTKLSSYLNQKVDFLKLDIEGAEYEVLQECKDKLFLVENIFVEYHSFVEKEQSLSEILGILKSAGFRTFLSPLEGPTQHPFVETKAYLGMDLQVNIFGVRPRPSSN